MRFGLILLVLLFAAAGAAFGALNNQPVSFDFYFGTLTLAKGGAMLFALLIGWFFGGVLIFVSLVLPLRARARRLLRQLRRHESAKEGPAPPLSPKNADMPR